MLQELLVRSHADCVDDAMIELLGSGFIDWDDQSTSPGGPWIQRFGRRIIGDDGYGTVRYERFDTVAEAEKEFEDRLFPDEWDAIVFEAGCHGYGAVSDGGRPVDDGKYFSTRELAEIALARQMVSDGVLATRCWFQTDRGNYWQNYEDIDRWFEPDDERGFVKLNDEARRYVSQALKDEHNEGLHSHWNNGENRECVFCNGSDDEGNTWDDEND